jgi:hypothetical protein
MKGVPEMNVTSMLSSGYLRPAAPVKPNEAVSARSSQFSQSSSLARQEQQILSQERALKSGAGLVSTTYRYTVGPDGQRYITGAEVTITGDEKTLDGIPGGVKREELKPLTKAVSKDDVSKSDGNENAAEKTQNVERADNRESEAAVSKVVNQLRQTEREVIAHEAAHKAAGGSFAGAVSYTYTKGPDGKSYITGGEVPISVPAGDDPEETLRNMEQVARAALAPGDPSGQDLSVAAQASAAAAQARQQIARQNGQDTTASDKKDATDDALKTGVASVQAGVRSEQIRSGNETRTEETIEPSEVRDAYARTASKRGMWALGRGFESGTGDDGTDRMEVAA